MLLLILFLLLLMLLLLLLLLLFYLCCRAASALPIPSVTSYRRIKCHRSRYAHQCHRRVFKHIISALISSVW
ncbi:hypothetical protein BZA70DRAFT_275099 [Myxozyma melibiosi]|uniref:Secreted peptide n=1 Tax=Myxozyma melibiosi TaxID=54550 RepID=A0ABR1FAB4_9ASCO